MTSVWEKKEVVEDYASDKFIGLQKPEQFILDEIHTELTGCNMLDIGVGGGRTTFHFAPMVKNYHGIDISNNMIKKCREKYGHWNNVKFDVASVVDLKMFEDSTFDFVLFSFNGIDYINNEDRHSALKEIKRVLKPHGMFVFSSHNYDAIYKLLDTKTNGFWFVTKLFLYNTFFGKKGNGYAIMNDGAHDFKLKTYYIKRSAQIEVLEDLGFKFVKTYDSMGESKIVESDEDWIYYFCRK